MVRFPLRRLVPYIAAAVVVVGVGAWTVGRPGGEGGDVVEFSSPKEGVEQDLAPDSGPRADRAPGAEPAPGEGAPTTATAAPIFVQVAGEVVRPGVYEVPAGSRVFEVLARAGGVTPEGDEESLPLAAAISDGARVTVPPRGAAADGGEGATQYGAQDLVQGGMQPGQEGPAGPLSLSAATAEELEGLPGIGPALAGQIVAFRETHGRFETVAELDDVPGIGPAILSRLRDLVVP